MFQYALSAPLPPHYQKAMAVLQCRLRATAPISSYMVGGRSRQPKKASLYNVYGQIKRMSRMGLFVIFFLALAFCYIIFVTLSPSSWYTMYPQVEGLNVPRYCFELSSCHIFLRCIICDNKPIWVELKQRWSYGIQSRVIEHMRHVQTN